MATQGPGRSRPDGDSKDRGRCGRRGAGGVARPVQLGNGRDRCVSTETPPVAQVKGRAYRSGLEEPVPGRAPTNPEASRPAHRGASLGSGRLAWRERAHQPAGLAREAPCHQHDRPRRRVLTLRTGVWRPRPPTSGAHGGIA